MEPTAAFSSATGPDATRRQHLRGLCRLTVLLAALCYGCGPDDSDKPLPQVPAATAQAANTDSDACLARTKGFLHWYARYFERSDNDTSTRFINFPLTADEDSATRAKVLRGNLSSTPYMQLNRRKLEVYLDTLRRSGYLSESYLADLRASILRRGRELEASRQTEGVVEGFEADEVLNTQDIYDLSAIEKLEAYQAANLKPGTQAYRLHMKSEFEDFSWYFYLRNENGRCVIDSLTNDYH